MTGPQRGRTPSPRILRWIILPSLMLVLFAALMGIYGALRTQRAAFRMVDHTHEVQRQIDATLSRLKDAETGQQGYLLTGDAEALAPYAQALVELPRDLKTLQQMIADNVVQQRHLADLRKPFDDKLSDLAEAIRLHDSGRPDDAIKVVRSGRGIALTHVLRSGFAQMSDEEQRLLDERDASAASSRTLTLISVGATGAISVLLLWLVYGIMARDAATRLESEERLASTFASVGDAIITTDVHGRIERMNPIAEKLTGWGLPEVRGKSLDQAFRIINAGTRQTVESPLARVLREGRIVGLANGTLLVGKDGSERPIEDSGAPIRDSTGSIVGVVLVFRDVSDRYAADRELAASEARFRGTFDNAAVGMAHVSTQGQFLRVNEAFLRITGYEDDALMRLTFADITHPDDLDADWQQATAVARGDIQRYSMQKRYRRPDGTYVWVNLTVGLQRDRDGAPLFYISSIQDITELLQTERALRESEARFRDIADATPVLIWISDVDGKCTWFNSRWLAFTGRSLEQDKGAGWIEGVHPDDLGRCVAVYEAAFARREAYRTEYRRRRADGEWRTLDASGVPRYIDGTFVGYIGSCTDVTEQRLDARALADNEEQLRLATEAAEIGLWDLEVASNTLYWPPRVKAMFGILSDRAVSLADFYNGLHPDDLAATSAAFDKAIDPKERALYDVEYRTIGLDDGVLRWVAAKGRALFRGDVCVRVLGTAIDITKRKLAEAQLVELNEQLERRVDAALAERRVFLDMIEATDARVLMLDPNYRILAINRATAGDLQRLFGVRAKVGDDLLSLLRDHQGAQSRAREYWSRALAGEEFTATDEFGDPRGERRHYEMKFNSLRDVNGRFLGAFQFVYDVTDRLREQARLAEAEQHLRQTQKFDAIGQLSGGIAHDFNNLLMVISGGLSLLARSKDSQQQQRIIERMRQAAERGSSLSRQLLTFARRQSLHAEPVDLRQQIGGMREILDRTLRGDVIVEADLSQELWPVMVDPTEFELVILNLCVNARDAMPKGGIITIAAKNIPGLNDLGLSGDFVCLTVTDTGVGMQPDVLARVFEPFFTTKETGKGTGLGLAQVYGFAQQSGGAVQMSSNPAHGTTASLFLPRSASAPARRISSSDSLESLAGPRPAVGSILLVEDSDEVAALVAEMLSELGYSATRVASAQAALGALADDREIDLVLSDVMMPGSINGLDLARELRRRRPNLPVILTTGYAGPALQSAYDDGIDVLAKPYELAALDAALSSARSKRR